MHRLQWRKRVKVTHQSNVNEVHNEVLRPDERVGLWITTHVGTMAFFGLLAAWILVWLVWNVGPWPHFDPGPAFVILLLGSNFIQLLLMPLIMVGQNVQSRHQEIQADVDHETLGYIREINETQLRILQALREREAPEMGPSGGIARPKPLEADGKQA